MPPTKTLPAQILLIPAPPKCRARDMRPLWRDLILKVWGGDPLKCPCCPGTMKPVRTFSRPEQIEFFLRLQGLWEGVIRTARHRLVEWKVPGAPAESATIELYDYQSDPLEKANLAPKKPAVVKKPRAILARYPEARVD